MYNSFPIPDTQRIMAIFNRQLSPYTFEAQLDIANELSELQGKPL